eukprot:CAMPEP_0198684826 /NCGR_PEP_ID=MMETSP1468-20131203/12767_1 /TAXON_ID=1461545 /ORGANISM="Mantoniella sp, Strain CCMP1436" /LENGTH=108 /DNA_ID=CAMNT_0044429931 /DNA_START=679 /DNA_END=1006 /DNA_ORIENTATION=-
MLETDVEDTHYPKNTETWIPQRGVLASPERNDSWNAKPPALQVTELVNKADAEENWYEIVRDASCTEDGFDTKPHLRVARRGLHVGEFVATKFGGIGSGLVKEINKGL